MGKYKKISTPTGQVIKLKNYLHGLSKKEIEQRRERFLKSRYRSSVSDLMNVDNGEREVYDMPKVQV